MRSLINTKPGIQRLWLVITSLLVFVLAFGAVAWRINKAPDIFTDEIVYTRMGIRVSGEGALVWDSGDPFVVHPPLYFLIQGIYQSFNGSPRAPIYAAGDIFSSVYNARYLNAIFAALTALVLYWLGKRLHGHLFGLLMAALFILDPFGVRINRRAMIETSAAFLSLAGVYTLLTEDEKKPISISRALFAGLFFGLALLTKELTFPVLVAVVLFSLWEFLHNRRQAIPALHAFIPIPVALLTYGLYPLWIMVSGDWNKFAAEKFLSLQRLLGLVQLTGWNRPGVSFVDLLIERLTQYGTSYLIFALGAVATMVLLLLGRQKRAGRFLAVWGLLLYPFFAFITLFGSGNDQFFYFLLGPAIILVSYAILVIATEIDRRFRKGSQPMFRLQFGRYQLSTFRVLAASLLIVILPVNLVLWLSTFATNPDNGYYKLTQFVNANLPPGAILNASGDPIKFRYFMPDRPISAAASPEEAIKQGVHYFVLAPKDVRLHYGRIESELAEWILAEGVQLYATSGDSYGDIFLYRVDFPDSTPSLPTKAENPSYWRSFNPAKAGFVSSLAWMLLLWITSVSTMAFGLEYLKRRPRRNRLVSSSLQLRQIRSDGGD